MQNKIQIIESYSKEVLEEFPVSEEELANQKMAFYQNTCDLSVELKKPTLVQDLHLVLNQGKKNLEELEREINDEISSHTSCSHCVDDENTETKNEGLT